MFFDLVERLYQAIQPPFVRQNFTYLQTRKELTDITLPFPRRLPKKSGISCTP